MQGENASASGTLVDLLSGSGRNRAAGAAVDLREQIMMKTDIRRLLIGGLLITGVVLAGCQKPVKAKPDYNRPLPPGASALRQILDPRHWPDLHEPWERKDGELITALERSQTWYAVPSSRQFFPFGDVSHIRAQASVYAFRTLLREARSASEFDVLMKENFDCYTSVGYDDRGSVLFTGYFTPIFKGSKQRTSIYQYPLYRKPADLDIDPITGKVHGRKLPGGGHAPYPTRRQLESGSELAGLELVYLPTRMDQYIIQVNGSAKIELEEGGVMYVGYAGTNGAEYTGLGATLVREGVIEPEKLNLAAIRAHFADKPGDLERYIQMNDRYVFFTEYDGNKWPAGSLGVKVTQNRTLATDKDIFPRGGVVLVNTHAAGIATAGGPNARADFTQWMADQDTGGAIRAAGRGDIYMGIGPQAEIRAGGQFAEGRLYYFFVKHALVPQWMRRMYEDPHGEKPAPEPAIPHAY
jgi:membrane-bound lytic murein transglycosylase A